ncbi:MAG: alpha-1,4-glucan--maltose-1-phosphate maltosyltransferase [Pseudomonadota bacterium]
MKQSAEINGRIRVAIETVTPEIDDGRFPIKRTIGELVVVQADIFADGHDAVSAILLYRTAREKRWHELSMRHIGNDRWEGMFYIREMCNYYYTLQAWVDYFHSWQRDVQKKANAGQDIRVDLLIGSAYIEGAAERATREDKKKLREYARLIRAGSDPSQGLSCALDQEITRLMAAYPDKSCTAFYAKTLAVTVDRTKALFSTWYEIFPRSCSADPQKPGTFRDCARLLPEIAKLGFDVLYFPPIHPIGKVNRKGRNNTPASEQHDPGSPWAIGSADGDHKAVEPSLGTLDDFRQLVKEAGIHGIEIALDIAYQCSPDHPYLAEHPEWFKKRPDGTVQFAENPPKKYEDIVPFHFETENWQDLWEELRSIILFWIEQGVRIFRVDNPHTKPFAFWNWLIIEIKQACPEVIFLAEAFTRPKVMSRLAKAGFTQSYTYFTWRNTKREITDYLTELTQTECREYFRPNFWPNTPDLLPEFLQYGGPPAFLIKLVLAATLSSNYGIFSPSFEQCITDAFPGKEEYQNSEKYEIKHWDWNKPGTIRELIARINRIRRENPALQTTWNLQFYDVDNDYLLFYGKATPDLSNVILVVVNLDPFHAQAGWLTIPIGKLGIDPAQTYLVHDLISNDKYLWQGERNFFEINPAVMPASIFRVHRRLRREEDFDYFM